MLYPETNPSSDQQPKIQLSTINERMSNGKKLYRAAWAIEILAATIGLGVALVQGIMSYESFGDEISGFRAMSEIVLAVFPFFMVAIVELLKIPIVYLVYTSPSFFQKLFFIVILSGLTFITFETVSGGFERQYTNLIREMSAPIAEIKQNDDDILSLESEITTWSRANETTISDKYVQLFNDRKVEYENLKLNLNERLKQMLGGSEARELANKEAELQALEEEFNNAKEQFNRSAQSKQSSSDKRRESLNARVAKIESRIDKNRQAIKDGCQSTIFFDSCSPEAESAQIENQSLKNELISINSQLSDTSSSFDLNEEENKLINKYEKRRSNIKREISRLKSIIANNNSDNPLVKEIESQLTNADKEYQQQIKDLTLLRSEEMEIIKNSKENIEKNRQEINKLNKENRDLSQSIADKATINQLYRFSEYWLKVFRDDKVCAERTPSTNPAPASNIEEFSITEYAKSTFNKIITPADENCKKWVQNAPLTHQEISDNVPKVAFIWFGSLAFLVAIMGIVVAYGSFILQYPRQKHYLREDSHWNFFRTLRRLFAAWFKKIRKPRPVKNIKVEVIKEVPVERIAITEVPVEVVKKEVVHTPIYTNDPDLLKFGTAKIKDILKKKKTVDVVSKKKTDDAVSKKKTDDEVSKKKTGDKQ